MQWVPAIQSRDFETGQALSELVTTRTTTLRNP
jgi:hypothetical protein